MLGQIVHRIAENLSLMGLFYNGNPIVVGNRIQGVTPVLSNGAYISWNAQDSGVSP